MNISKSLFKNLSRCSDFASLYDMYIYRNAHHVREINGFDIRKLNDDLKLVNENIFNEELEITQEIFRNMFDEEIGTDLTVTTNDQLLAFSEYFKKVEILAGEMIEKKFSGATRYNLDTKKQKKFSFKTGHHEYYCYLDIYNESPNGVINIFEVKSTTTNKFIKLGRELHNGSSTMEKLKSQKFDSIFMKCHDGIIRLKDEVMDDFTSSNLPKKAYFDYRNKLLDRYSPTGVGKYVYDLAVERYIVENSFSKLENKPKINYYLMVLNGDYIYNGDCLMNSDGINEPFYNPDEYGNEVISIIDLTKITGECLPTIEKDRLFIEESIKRKTICGRMVSHTCEVKKTTECPFKNVCFSKTNINGSIMEYMNKTNAFKGEGAIDGIDIYKLINTNHFSLDSIPRNYLKHQPNLVQYDSYVNNNIYIDKEKMKKVLDNLKYPLYYLDFETFAAPLPRFYKEVPYMQSVFQFSLHIEKTSGDCDKENNHYEYLAPDQYDHRRELCEKLIEYIDLSKGGTVIVYNENFEKTRLKELSIIFPDLSEKLLLIRNSVFDLLLVLKGSQKMFMPFMSNELTKKEKEEEAKKINYYNNSMHGSFSIKKVLPVFSNLSYNDLDVKNGTEAVLVYGLLPTYTKEEYERKYLALRKYCEQDTWAMVEILWGIKKLYKEN